MKYVLIGFLLILTGCAADYKLYSESVTSIETARFNAEGEKYKAMAAIAASGSDSAKVAAVMSMTLGNQAQQQQSSLRMPESPGDSIFKWVSLLAPTVTQAYAIKANTQLGIAQSNNSASIAQSTNNTFLGIAGKIQNPQANVNYSTANTTATNTDNHSVTGSNNPSTITHPLQQPVVTPTEPTAATPTVVSPK